MSEVRGEAIVSSIVDYMFVVDFSEFVQVFRIFVLLLVGIFIVKMRGYMRVWRRNIPKRLSSLTISHTSVYDMYASERNLCDWYICMQLVFSYQPCNEI